MMPATIQFSFLIPDEDGSEFERELAGALEGLSVTSTAEKLSKVGGHIHVNIRVFILKLMFHRGIFNRPVKAPAARSLI